MRFNLKQMIFAFTALTTVLFFQNCADSMDIEEYSNQSSTSAANGSDPGAGNNSVPVPTTPAVEAVTISSATVNQTVPLDSAVDLSVNAAGTNVIYQWYKNDVAIPGATNRNFNIPKAIEADSGTYKVIASNSVNSAIATMTLNVVRQPNQYPPTLTLAAKDIFTFAYRSIYAVPTNGIVNLTVSATNAASYQWHYKSRVAGAVYTPIAGAAGSSYSFTLRAQNNNPQFGYYKVVISNAYGVIEDEAYVGPK